MYEYNGKYAIFNAIRTPRIYLFPFNFSRENKEKLLNAMRPFFFICIPYVA